MNREDNLCWFHGKVSRERAEQILREDGLGDGVFLVRDCNTSIGDYVLSVLHKGEVLHYQIRRHGEDAFFSIGEQTPIHGLDSLIEHYQEASNGLVTQLTAIVKRDPPPHDSRSHGRTNLLHRATKEGEITVACELLKCGYRNIDAKNQDGQTAVHLACRFVNEKILRKLIESGANVNCRDSEGNTPLHYACRSHSLEVIKMLVAAKANIQARNNTTGCVPLHDAAKQGNLEAIKELLRLGAPHMPRSADGELPQDYAKDGGHHDIVEFLENYTPPEPTVFRINWYHETLGRHEANAILKQYAKNLSENLNNTQQDENENNENDDQNNKEDRTAGTFLIRYSEKNKDFVLSLLYDGQPMHFMIQKYLKLYYIDEGPYLPSLEHLVQHYMHFSDGLPINLKRGIAPKPKPPLPLFSTIPKKGRQKITSPTQQPSNVANNSASIDDITVFTSATKMTRNLSIPTDALMNTVGLMGSSSNSTSDILKFNSIKSPSKINKIKDGMRSLRKSKTKSKDENAITVQNVEELSPTLTNIKFKSDLKPVAYAPTPASTYDVPVSNMTVAVEINTCPMYNENANEETEQNSVNCMKSSEIDNNNFAPNADEDDDYLTENDSGTFNSNDKDSEEIYFIDAPTKEKVTAELARSTSIKYTPFKNVPYFPDGTMIPQTNSNGNDSTETNSNNNNNNRFERLDSNISQISIDSSIFGHRLSTALDSSTVRTSSPSSLARRIHNKPNYFIPIDQLALHEILGEGEFGSVYRGTVAIGEDDNGQGENKVPVAIKTLRDEHCKQNQADFLREASVMIKLSHHCIVKLIGISRGPPLMMVQELVALGSMLDYLVLHADEINVNFELKIWASQIACGMNYLESQHFVHRDLAARNILLASKNQAKISDFGLSKALNSNDYYQASQGGKWPIKWYAPESFNFGTFSHASDVWSFGVTLWEMFSFGIPPYGEMKGVDVIKLVEMGERLPKPEQCADNVFAIMENCWNYHPKDRPTFRHLTEFFARDPDYQNVVELIKTEHIS